MANLKSSLRQIVNQENLFINELLKNHLYTNIGGPADYVVTPTTVEQLQLIIKLAKETNYPLVILGNGSNVIVNDGGIRGIVILTKKLRSISVDGNLLKAESGALLSEVANYALNNNLTGLEFASGIPGTVGGAVIMNAGAYGGEIKDVLQAVQVITKNGKIVTYEAAELQLAYRESSLSNRDLYILSATFSLRHNNYEQIKQKIDKLTALRKAKQPLEFPSCGSVFKRPEGYYAGKLIQDCQLQGFQIGDAKVSKKHAGFIINKKAATASDYVQVIEHIKQKVYEQFAIKLEREVKLIKEDGSEQT